jgi:hypothetical protein
MKSEQCKRCIHRGEHHDADRSIYIDGECWVDNFDLWGGHPEERGLYTRDDLETISRNCPNFKEGDRIEV